MSVPPTSAACLSIAAGARATESLLLDLLAPLVESSRRDWRLLARPVRIVVSSRSLRDHLCAKLVQRFGSALAGLQVQTLQGLARELLERVCAGAASGEDLVPILVRAAARGEPLLWQELGALHDGFGAVVGSVRDLLDAGFSPVHADAAEESLAGVSTSASERARAIALLRVAGGVVAELEKLGVESRASLLRRACDALLREGDRALPQRAVLIHGFADATGVALDLIEGLVRRCGAHVLLDRPPDPAEPGRADLGCAFTARFAERLEGAAQRTERPATVAPPSALVLLEAPGGSAEVRGVAVRIRQLLDAGAAPESIGIVARTLAPYTTHLLVHLGRLGVPFSGAGLRAGPDAVGRRLRALLQLLERGEETPAERWLDARASPASAAAGATSSADLRTALHALGAARLRHVAELRIEERLRGASSFPLPVRMGLESEGDAGARALRRRVPAAALTDLVQSARTVCAELRAWPDAAALRVQLARLRSFLEQGLRWSEAEPARGPLLEALDELDSELPPTAPIDRADLLLLLDAAVARRIARPLGGEGAGVQVLDAIEARARSFEHLFVLGLNRDVFPRVVLEDPLLPDALRVALAKVLPDLPRKLGGFDEERYLFAQLVSASPRVTLSWQSLDDDGKERALSTLVERLRLAERAPAVETLPAPWSAVPSPVARPALEHAVLAGLHGSRAAVAKVMPVALSEAAAEAAASGLFDAAAAAVDAASAAHARLAALDALEPRDAACDTVGPGFGFVGAWQAGDPREGRVAITTLERMARCPWQTFLGRVLHVEPAPDALEALPSVDALLLGTLLHRGVEAIVKAGIPGGDGSLAAARREGARPVAWPGDTELRRLLALEAERLLRDEGLVFDGLSRVLARRAEPLLRQVFEHVWRPAEDMPRLFGAELTGELEVRDGEGHPRTIGFRADLAEESGGGVRLIDLKSGAPVAVLKTEGKRREKLLAEVARGRLLQAAAYACAVAGEGRYLYADPERSAGYPVWSIAHDDPELVPAFHEAVAQLLDGWDRGSFLPRLELPDGSDRNAPCRSCRVAEACIQGDTGARRRLRRWARSPVPSEGPAGAALAAAHALFHLDARTGRRDEPAAEDGA